MYTPRLPLSRSEIQFAILSVCDGATMNLQPPFPHQSAIEYTVVLLYDVIARAEVPRNAL
jgi:hypothetical protein